MTKTVFITNPAPGGSKYTSTKKANEFVARGRAVFEYGMLRFINRLHTAARAELGDMGDAVFWNGEDKDPFAMRRPGEVRS